MNKMISMGILAGGVLLIVFGISAMNSFSSDISRLFTGAPTDRSIYMLIVGVILAAIGSIGLMPGSNNR